MAGYVLEAQRYTKSSPLFVHVGYVNYVFGNRATACEFYYDQYPDMRSINSYEDYTSDWSPVDGLRYVVVPYNNQDLEARSDESPLAVSALQRMDEQIRIKSRDPRSYRPRLIDWEDVFY